MDCPSCGSANPEGKKFCGDCGAALTLAGGAQESATPGSSALSLAPASHAERRQLTLMFCDLVGSTALSARLDPEDLREIIGAYHRCVAETVTRFGGFVAKYMGDGVLVYFGYPQAHEDDAERAVRAALALAESVRELHTGEALQVRIGIATGLVIVGDLIGSGEAQERGVVGETPNLAARLQAAAEPGSVVIAASTRRLTGGLFEYEDLGAVAAKGFAEPVLAFRVLREGTAESRYEALHAEGGLTPLVGRGEEIGLLLRRWQRAKSGQGQVVLISGEPGIGKSRITAAIQARIAGEPHACLRYFCSPHHTDSALYPIITELEHAACFEREDTADTKFSKLEAMLAYSSASAEDIALLAELLSLQTEGRYQPLEFAPKEKRARTLAALARQLDGLARERPVLILFEDAHWIDPTSLDVLSRMAESAQRLPVLLIVTFRPEFQPPWMGEPYVTALTLSRLVSEEGEALAELVAGGKALPQEVLGQIVTRTDGVPLFVEELTKTVLESGLLREEKGRYALQGPLPPFAIPTSLHASLMARLDRLAPEREVAQIGAVIGREFSYGMVAAVAHMPDDELRRALGRLVSAELAFARGSPPDATYTFKHALVQDAAYSTLLRARRQQLHAAVARVLEEQEPERAQARPELIAHHLTEAGQIEAATHYWLKAGRRSAERSADREAVRHLERGLEVLMRLPASLDRDRVELEFQLALGTPLISLHGWSGSPVAAAYERASALCEQLGDSVHLVPTLFGLASNRVVGGQTRAALAFARKCRSTADHTGDRVTRLLSHRAMGAALRQLGRLTEARTEFESILPLYEPELDRSLAASCITDPRISGLSLLSQVLWVMGYPTQADRTAREAFRSAAELGHTNTLGHVHVHAGAELGELRRDVPAARKQARATIELAEKHHMRGWRGYGLVIRGWALALEGQTREGIECMR
ncbi:adenylate/guanylate cyclase domain-containing protein [Microvirga massiliensis]|uniref:adenylate/guanylate cyclase domain-containing protein n=1 Tax=Microvirga massiliensis TaxID=1033741 RepID=UPI00069A0D5A|nr:adenylate/guanylate cyclase domain-containing protein [Microvirga massiliensis]